MREEVDGGEKSKAWVRGSRGLGVHVSKNVEPQLELDGWREWTAVSAASKGWERGGGVSRAQSEASICTSWVGR